MNFGRISERLMKLAVSMNYLKLMRLFLDLFTVLQCQCHSHLFLRTDRFHSRAYGGLLYINMAAFFLFCTPIWPP